MLVGESVVISADLIVATTGLLATFGSGAAWLTRRMDRKFARVEKRYATLRVCFQMVANELARLEPHNAVLHRAQLLLLRDYGDPVDGDGFDDLLAKIE